jgi:2-polyprenyl-6-methoxyphenol hydroxylase-like FAD-dependent oxidoreductase
MNRVDAAIRGDGVVARTLALALARQGLAVALPMNDAPAPARDDIRAYALNAQSVALLARLGIWDALPDDARTAVYDMRIEGDAHGASLGFSAWQQRVRELAWIVDAATLLQRLGAAVR